ncbi:MAG TPA: penicillin-binding protein 2, partial [Firmicutes bacterium]|nr:penicillin-binding protein 2 [Bacillota bacterium]
MLDGRRTNILCFFLLACSLVLTGRLFWLQCLNSETLMEMGIKQRSMAVRIEPDRGIIVDRNGEPLVGNCPALGVGVFPGLVREPARVSRLVAQVSGLPEHDIARRLASGTPFSVPVASLPPGETGMEAVKREIAALTSQGVVLYEGRVRYARGNMAAHLIGYLASMDGHGASGLEASFDRYLSRGSGTRLVAFVNANSRLIPGLGYRLIRGQGIPYGTAHDGSTCDMSNVALVLTIDRRIQAIVEETADKYLDRGAVVVMDPRTGDILAMTSRPTFDPNNPAQFFGDPGAPLVNRAISAYPPGSVLKVLVAAAAIQEGVVTPQETFEDPGYIDVGSVRFRCYKADEGGHGSLTFAEAMSVSCNPVFIHVGQRLGRRKLVEYMEACGLGGLSGSGLPGERPGVIP